MKKLLLLIVLMLTLFSVSVSAQYWNASFSERQCLVINNADITLPSNTTINATLNTAALIADGKMQADCGDLRVIYGGTTQTNYTFAAPRFGNNGCNNAATSVVFKTIANTAPGVSNDYCFYYGNASTTNGFGDARSAYLPITFFPSSHQLYFNRAEEPDTGAWSETINLPIGNYALNKFFRVYLETPNFEHGCSDGSGSVVSFTDANNSIISGVSCVGTPPRNYGDDSPIPGYTDGSSSDWIYNFTFTNFSSTNRGIYNKTGFQGMFANSASREFLRNLTVSFVWSAGGDVTLLSSFWYQPYSDKVSYSLLEAESFRGVKFTGETPANNSFVYEGQRFTINVSVSGFNFTRAFLNFSGALSNNSLEHMSVQNSTTVILTLATPTGQHGLFTVNNDTTANVSTIHTRSGSATANVSLNGVVIGSVGASGYNRFVGVQNLSVKGDNVLSFLRTSGGAGDTVTFTLSQLNFSKRDYEFGFAYNLTPGTYSYSYTVLSEGQTFTTGTRFITVQANVSPAWSNAFTTPTSPATYSPTATYNFNVTWTDVDLSIVRMIHNFAGVITNTTVSSATTAFNYAFGSIAAGNYSWRQSANDTQGNTNVTTNFSFVVLQAASLATLTIGGSNGTNVTQPTASTVVINATRITGTGNMSLIADGVFNQSTSGNNIAINFSFYNNRTYPFTVTIAESQNYSAFSVTHTAIVPPPPVFNETGFLTAGSCPTDSLPKVSMYVFLIALLFAMIFLSEKVDTTQPFKGGVMVIVGMGIIAHSVTTLYCSSIIGAVEMVFALMLMVFGAARIWRG